MDIVNMDWSDMGEKTEASTVDLMAKIKQAMEAFDALPASAQAAHREAQRQSYGRSCVQRAGDRSAISDPEYSPETKAKRANALDELALMDADEICEGIAADPDAPTPSMRRGFALLEKLKADPDAAHEPDVRFEKIGVKGGWISQSVATGHWIWYCCAADQSGRAKTKVEALNDVYRANAAYEPESEAEHRQRVFMAHQHLMHPKWDYCLMCGATAQFICELTEPAPSCADLPWLGENKYFAAQRRDLVRMIDKAEAEALANAMVDLLKDVQAEPKPEPRNMTAEEAKVLDQALINSTEVVYNLHIFERNPIRHPSTSYEDKALLRAFGKR